MRLILSCFKCGSIDFKNTGQFLTNIEGESYLVRDDYKESKVICSRCGLEDYVENLVIVFK
jgi:predicted nucleic-acid-binding Zn-ribbon protein